MNIPINQDDQDLQDWLDAQEPVIDAEHARAMRHLQHQIIPRRTFEEQRAELKRDLELQAYARAIGVTN